MTQPPPTPTPSAVHPSSPTRTILTAALGFAPWIVYWALLGAVSFRVAVSVAVATSLVLTLAPLARRRRPADFDLGTAAVFVVLLLVTYATDDVWLERWVQPVTNAGLFAVATVLQGLGRPFTLPYARAAVDPDTAAEPGFRWVNRVISAGWCVTFALMTVVSAVPPLVQGDATVHDGGSLVSVLGYWVVPFTLLGLTGWASGTFPSWFVAALERPRPDRSAPVSDPPPSPAAGGPSLRLDPVDSPADAAVVVTAQPAADGQLRVGLADADGTWWWTEQPVTAADLTHGVDVSAWTADLRPGGAAADLDVFAPALRGRFAVAFAPAPGAAATAVAHGTRRFAAAGVRVEPVQTATVVGRVFVPDDAGPRPAVVLFPGSEGGLDSQSANAALLASHGWVAMVAATCAVDGRPDVVDGLPLELFADAVGHLAARPDVDADRVAALGISKGAEGLLAAATLLPLPVRGLALLSPSDRVWQAVGPGGPVRGHSSWTLGGRPLPYDELDGEALMPQLLRNAVRGAADRRAGRVTVLRLLDAYAATGPGPAVLDVRAVDAPLLLVAGAEDSLWPSAAMAGRIAAARARTDDEVVVHPAAGHLLALPVRPTTPTSTDGIAFGGTPAGTAAAQADLGPRLLRFLARTTGARVASADVGVARS